MLSYRWAVAAEMHALAKICLLLLFSLRGVTSSLHGSQNLQGASDTFLKLVHCFPGGVSGRCRARMRMRWPHVVVPHDCLVAGQAL